MVWLLACESTLSLGEDVDTAPDSADDADVDTDTLERIDDTAPADSQGSDDTGGPPEIRGDALFGLDRVHTVEITLGREGRAALDGDPYTYVSSTLTFDGESYPNVGVRIKGRLGSLRTLDSKAALKVDMLEFGEVDELDGIEKFNLNNMVQDCAKVHELAAYGIHRMVGTPAPRVGYAEVTVDGQDHGLYAVVEDYDDEFLQDNFADPTGNLYDGDYWLYPDGNYVLVDFNTSAQRYFTLDEGVANDQVDIAAVTDRVGAGADALEPLVDLEQHARFLAASAWTGHVDSYSYYSNNYRVYFDPGRGGRAVFLPWDPDWAFYAATDVNALYGVVSAVCVNDPACSVEVGATIDTLNATVATSALAAEVQAAIELIGDALDRDPMLETSRREIRGCQADLFDWFDRRGGELDASGW